MKPSLHRYAAALDAARGLTWPARRPVTSATHGSHLSRVRGTTVEFIEHRAYRQGDDIRRIDWKLFARTDRVFVRVSRELALLPTAFVVDATASMAFPSSTLAKWQLACELTMGLAAVARHRADPVGLVLVAGDGERVVEPRSRRTVLDEMMAVLSAPPQGRADLASATRRALSMAKRVVVISDFLGDADALLALARASAAEGKEIYAAHVVASEELDPDPRRALLEDPEERSLRRPMSAAARATYLQQFGAWRDQLARDWRRAGAVYAMCIPRRETIRRTLRRVTSAVRDPAVGAT